jgi:hypothetical protein
VLVSPNATVLGAGEHEATIFLEANGRDILADALEVDERVRAGIEIVEPNRLETACREVVFNRQRVDLGVWVMMMMMMIDDNDTVIMVFINSPVNPNAGASSPTFPSMAPIF